MPAAARFLSILPTFVVSDVRAAAEHYRDVLGFRLCMLVGEAPRLFSIVDLAEGEGLHLAYADGGRARENRSLEGELSPASEAIDAYVRVDDARRTQAELARRGARILYAPVERPWRMCEFEVEDRDEFVFCFGSDLDGAAPPHGVAGSRGKVKIAPVLLVADVVRSVAFYREQLGFAVCGLFGNPPHYAIVSGDRALIHLARATHPGQLRSNRASACIWDAFVETRGIDALAEELRARSVPLTRGIDTTEYEMRELEIEDPDGHALCFGEPVAGWDDDR